MKLDGRSVLDVSILFAMIVYGIVALFLHALIDWQRPASSRCAGAGCRPHSPESRKSA